MPEQPPAYGQHGLWRDAGNMDEERARQLAFDNLELRGRSPDEVAAREAYLDLLDIGPDQQVLEIGCGSGVVLRDIARRLGPSGIATGIDPSASLLEIARDLAQRDGQAERIRLHQGDALALPFADATFDVVLAVTVLIHIPGGAAAVPEMVRVTRPGGRIAVFDRDNDSLIASHPDRALTRRIVAAGADASAADSWLPRRIPGLFAKAGLSDIRTRGFTTLERDPAGFYGHNLARFAALARDVGAITEAEHRSWTEGLQEQAAENSFLAGITHLFIWGQKPG